MPLSWQWHQRDLGVIVHAPCQFISFMHVCILIGSVGKGFGCELEKASHEMCVDITPNLKLYRLCPWRTPRLSPSNFDSCTISCHPRGALTFEDVCGPWNPFLCLSCSFQNPQLKHESVLGTPSWSKSSSPELFFFFFQWNITCFILNQSCPFLAPEAQFWNVLSFNTWKLCDISVSKPRFPRLYLCNKILISSIKALTFLTVLLKGLSLEIRAHINTRNKGGNVPPTMPQYKTNFNFNVSFLFHNYRNSRTLKEGKCC